MKLGRCNSKAWLWALPLLVWLAGSACGVKTSPLPAGVLLPDRVSRPLYRFDENGELVITFRPPLKNVRGLPLKDLGGFFIDRSENRIEPGFCPGCPVQYTSRARMPALDPAPLKTVRDTPYHYRDRLRPGHVYHYRVFAHDSDGEYDPSLFASLVVFYDHPARPPETVVAAADDRLVTLTWDPVDRLTAGRPVEDLAGYDIHRREAGGTWERLNPDEPWGRSRFQDARVVNGRAYEYKVRTVRRWRGTRIEGPPSKVIRVIPVDLTPPPPPVKVYAASVKTGVTLTWPEVDASDLAGYRVYRRGDGEERYQRVGPDLVRKNLFIDSGATTGRTYFYRVTAVDGSPAANESEPAPDVRIRLER